MNQENNLSKSFESLSAATQSAYNLAPLVVILISFLAIPVVLLTTISTGLMKTTAVLLVLIVSLGIFIARNKFGEALFSLIGGLVAILRVDWTVGLYIAFWSAWLGFSLLALLISSLRLAANFQDVVLQAAVFLRKDKEDISKYENELKLALKRSDTPHLKPVERAEIARFFVFRKFPVDTLPQLIKATENLSALSKVEINSIASCVSDAATTLNSNTLLTSRHICDPFFSAIQEARATPDEFFEAFIASRKFLINSFLSFNEYLQKIASLLDLGLSSSEINDELKRQYNREEG